ncbi:MAG: hypothetical protein QFX35_05810 [Candidatus Verstraetearchaeota archaeon]|nr:hypothetical protein [Candidatus Verstraetearchaeota archaeon]
MPGEVGYCRTCTVPVDEKGMPLRPSVKGCLMKKQILTTIRSTTSESFDEYVKKIEHRRENHRPQN